MKNITIKKITADLIKDGVSKADAVELAKEIYAEYKEEIRKSAYMTD